MPLSDGEDRQPAEPGAVVSAARDNQIGAEDTVVIRQLRYGPDSTGTSEDGGGNAAGS